MEKKLFITAQDMPAKEWKDDKGVVRKEVATFNEITVPINKSLGFRPMFAIPITTYRETVTRMLMATMNYPVLFCIFETDDYVRIDKLKQYETNMKGFRGDRADIPIFLASPDEPDYLTEYCLNIESLSPIPLFYGNILGLYYFSETGDSTHLPESFGFRDDKTAADFLSDLKEIDGLDYLTECLQKLPSIDHDAFFQQAYEMGWKSENFEDRYQDTSAWVLYKHLLMPIILWSFCSDTKDPTLERGAFQFDMRIFESCLHNISGLVREENNEAYWSFNDCSRKGFDAIYQAMYNMIGDSIPVLEHWFLHDHIGRNDPCPCGSGKKYKKCHGRYS